jgi:hypothetical protein
MALAALVLAGLVPLIWPGDIPFINDEPQLIAGAVDANLGGRLATMGLLGTYGFVYGPAPVWVYQALMAASHDLVIVAVLHTLLMSVVTAAALWWLSRSLGLWVWFAPLPLLSPYHWFYARVLWDNTFLLPLGALALAGYAAHLESESPLGLRVSLAAMAAIPLVHLMGASLLLPLAAHMLIVQRRALWARKYSIAGIAAAALWLAWPYWTYLVGPRPATPGDGPALGGFVFPLLGGRLLGAQGLDYFYGPSPVGGRLFGGVAALSCIAYALVWGGLAVALVLIARARQSRQWTARAHIAAIAVASLVCESVIHGISARFQHPHYQNGVWISLVVLAWFAVDFLATRRGPVRIVGWAAPVAAGLLAATLLGAVSLLAVGLHRSRGTRDIYGPTIANQQQVARALARYAQASDVQIHVNMWERFPHTIAILRRLNVSHRADLPQRVLEVRYATDDPASGAIEMVER